jgi:hypothetical protein
MKLITVLLTAGLFGLGGTGGAMATVTVTFVKPENFADMPFMQSDKDRVLKDIEAHINKLGTQLPAGQDLSVEILDVDLAGRMEPQFRGAQEVRILRGGADWPTIELRYRLEAKGAVIKRGESRVADMNYLRHRPRYEASDIIRYEKQMLDEWFNRTLREPAVEAKP